MFTARSQPQHRVNDHAIVKRGRTPLEVEEEEEYYFGQFSIERSYTFQARKPTCDAIDLSPRTSPVLIPSPSDLASRGAFTARCKRLAKNWYNMHRFPPGVIAYHSWQSMNRRSLIFTSCFQHGVNLSCTPIDLDQRVSMEEGHASDPASCARTSPTI